MGFPSIPRKRKVTDSTSSPLRSPTPNSYIRRPHPLRTLTAPIRSSKRQVDHEESRLFFLPLRPITAATPVTPPRSTKSKRSSRGSLEVPHIGRTRISTPLPPSINSFAEPSPDTTCIQELERLELHSPKGRTSLSDAFNPRRLSVLFERSTAGRRSHEMDICVIDAEVHRDDQDKRQSRRASISKAFAEFMDAANSSGTISEITSKVTKISNRISWSLDQRPSKRARTAAGFP